MTEQKRQEIENLLSEECAEDECKENIVDILKSKEDISDNRFEKIVDLRDYISSIH